MLHTFIVVSYGWELQNVPFPALFYRAFLLYKVAAKVMLVCSLCSYVLMSDNFDYVKTQQRLAETGRHGDVQHVARLSVLPPRLHTFSDLDQLRPFRAHLWPRPFKILREVAHHSPISSNISRATSEGLRLSKLKVICFSPSSSVLMSDNFDYVKTFNFFCTFAAQNLSVCSEGRLDTRLLGGSCIFW